MMIRRSGTTLIEVLVAIFVTALGLLGLLALFPLAALSMAQAIKDSRCAQAAANAFALAAAMNIRNDPLLVGQSGDVFRDPGIFDLHNNRIEAKPDGPSYPIYVDPFGFYTTAGRNLPTVGIARSTGETEEEGPPPILRPSSLPRRTVSFMPTSNRLPTTLRYFALLDDIKFGVNGQSAAAVQRDGRYSWAYLLRRPRAADRSLVDLTVVVYSGRTLRFKDNDTAVADLGERAYDKVAFDPSSNVVTVTWDPSNGQEKPAVRNGSWILDATMVKEVPPKSGMLQPDPHGFFYRVVNVTEKGTNALDLELQTKPRLSTINITPGRLPFAYGVLVVLDNVAEVFEKGPGWRP